MKRKIASLVILAICCITLAFTENKSQKTIQQNKQVGGFAVVELFTSEGCSSCPPADALIAKLQQEIDSKPIYILAYHVDYWNRLGWKDSFSDSKFSNRQNQYANWLNLKSIYTPQIVVNGAKEFVGSEESTLRKSVSTVLSSANENSLNLQLQKQNGEELVLVYNTNQKAIGYNLVVATVIPNAVNQISKGENKGKTLAHVQIVEQLETIILNGKATGAFKLNLKKPKTRTAVELIAFLQNQNTGKITAATKLKSEMIHI